MHLSLPRAERFLGLQGSQPGGWVPRPSLDLRSSWQQPQQGSGEVGSQPGPAHAPPTSQGPGATADRITRPVTPPGTCMSQSQPGSETAPQPWTQR